MGIAEIILYGEEKMKKRIVKIILLSFTILAGCSSNQSEDYYKELNKSVEQQVDLWTSVNYQIITDKQKINKIDKSFIEAEEAVMIQISAKTKNQGNKRAESINIKFNEPTPLKFIHGTSQEGITNGYLDKNDEYEYYFTYIFKDNNGVSDFINRATVKVTWTEDKVNKELEIKLPGKPIQ